jgi:hypothetical protein
MIIEFLIRQAPYAGRFSTTITSFEAEMPCVPRKGETIYIGDNTTQLYTVLDISYEFPKFDKDQVNVPHIIVGITPKGIT